MQLFSGLFPKSVVVAEPGECKCVNCKGVIKADAAYLLFTDESLHRYCLTDYLQKMDLLKVVIRQHGQFNL